MRSTTSLLLGAAAYIAGVKAQKTLANVCTSSNAANALPLDLSPGIIFNSASVTANAVIGWSVTNATFQPNAVFDFCNVSFTYSHPGKNDVITLTYWLPSPQDFQNRYLSTGGGGYAINSGTGGLAMGVPYGAVTGITDGGFGPADNFLANGVFLYSNGSINYEEQYMFAYSGHHELAIIGKNFTQNFYDMGESKLYSYYQGCSEGGREGFSQVQRYADQFDGTIIGAPAIRLPFQQIQHLYSGVVEQTMDHYPPTCAFELIVNETIKACDPLDGLTDGVVARTDLCMLNYDISVLVGKAYSCPATTGSFEFGPPNPAVNGTLSKKDIAVAKKCLQGLHDSEGRRAYWTYQPSAFFTDATTSYNATSNTFYAAASSLGGGWVTEALEEVQLQNLPSLEGITYDTLVGWIKLGMQKYYDTFLTTWPDLSPYHNAGGKIIHFHGESDFSIPTASSVRYFESVRHIMYGGMSMLDGAAALSEWYKLFLVPGAGHCAANPGQANGPFPQTNLQVMIDWVEKDVVPTTLNATHLAGSMTGQNAQLCAWPSRPLWSGKNMTCVFDEKSYQTWIYNLNAIPLPVY